MSEQQEQEIKGPGRLLKEARERANLSLQDIADKVRLKKSVVEDIEHDNYDPSISLTFIKGYLKLYAKQVQVEEADVISAFENLNPQSKEPAKVKSFSRRVTNQANDDKLMLVTYLILAVVIALVVIWWFQQDKGLSDLAPSSSILEETPSSLPEQRESNAIDNDSAAVSKIDNKISSFSEQQSDDNLIIADEPVDTSIVEPVDDSFSSVTEDLVVTTQDLPISPSETSEPVNLVFEFSDDCWMNLADATGENIAYGVKVKGRIMPVTGIPPFAVTLGASEVVKISYEGEPVDLSFLKPGTTARFTLPLSE